MEQKYNTLIFTENKNTVTFWVFDQFWPKTTRVLLPNAQYQRVKYNISWRLQIDCQYKMSYLDSSRNFIHRCNSWNIVWKCAEHRGNQFNCSSKWTWWDILWHPKILIITNLNFLNLVLCWKSCKWFGLPVQKWHPLKNSLKDLYLFIYCQIVFFN